jgi:hypothetical protein
MGRYASRGYIMQLVKIYRVTIFVPPDYLDVLKAAICDVDPLNIGTYEHVMWTSFGTKEQFRPIDGAKPTAGVIGESINLETVRLEFCIQRDPQRLQHLLENAVFPHHPWEVPAVFVDESIFPMK